MTKLQDSVDEFLDRGFHAPYSSLTMFLRDTNFNYGKFSARKNAYGSSMHSSHYLFGKSQVNYIYDADRPELIRAQLRSEFHAQNPTPSVGMRRAFTWLLHEHGLHSAE